MENLRKQLNNLLNKYQKGGQVPYSEKHYDESDIKSFYNSMIGSDWYKNRLIKNGYDKQYSKGVDKIIEGRLQRVNAAFLGNIQKNDGGLNQLFRFLSSGEVVKSGSGSYYNPDTGEISLVKSQLDTTRTHPRTVIAHEYGHAETLGGISRKEIEMLTPEKKGLSDHDTSPTERKSDINAIRYNLYKTGQFDPNTGKYKTKTGQFDSTMFEKIKTDKALQRNREIYGDEKLIELINTVAQNENSSENPQYVKSGGEIRSTLNNIIKKYEM